jgi:hypothetical protein
MLITYKYNRLLWHKIEIRFHTSLGWYPKYNSYDIAYYVSPVKSFKLM